MSTDGHFRTSDTRHGRKNQIPQNYEDKPRSSVLSWVTTTNHRYGGCKGAAFRPLAKENTSRSCDLPCTCRAPSELTCDALSPSYLPLTVTPWGEAAVITLVLPTLQQRKLTHRVAI